MKICTKCNKKHNKSSNLCNKCYFEIPENREKRRIHNNMYYLNNKNKRAEIMRKHLLKKRYYIKEEDYKLLLIKQNYKCAICQKEIDKYDIDLRRKLVIDHNHITGKVRGLLCITCNTMISKCDKNSDILYKAIDYLK